MAKRRKPSASKAAQHCGGEDLRARLGPSMAQAQRVIRAETKPHHLNSVFESDLLMELVRFQPTKRIRPDRVVGFVRARRSPHNNVCLFAVDGDGVRVDVSVARSVRNLYGKHDAAAEKRKRVVSAFRNETFFSPMMQAARADKGGRERRKMMCEGCGRSRHLALDHDGKPFAQILDEFVAHQRMGSFDRIGLAWSNGSYTLRSRAMAKKWREWHDSSARIVGLCIKCNSSKGSGGYRHTFGGQNDECDT